ncbi:ubiquinol-cytochrome c reductase cytochrome c1 subunit [Bartonella sp. AR 15-3]|nr:ubiquinol-cytochrome c reductase cytochrome c1 subunit [Bartonella sp. AR 15-3]
MIKAFIGLILIGVMAFSFKTLPKISLIRENMFFSSYVPQKQDWNFSGSFGIYDKVQLRRE